MKDQLDQRIHQLVTEVHDAAPLPPPMQFIPAHQDDAAARPR
jgi:hypothetical protein